MEPTWTSMGKILLHFMGIRFGDFSNLFLDMSTIWINLQQLKKNKRFRKTEKSWTQNHFSSGWHHQIASQLTATQLQLEFFYQDAWIRRVFGVFKRFSTFLFIEILQNKHCLHFLLDWSESGPNWLFVDPDEIGHDFFKKESNIKFSQSCDLGCVTWVSKPIRTREKVSIVS